MTTPQTFATGSSVHSATGDLAHIGTLLHSLSNKLLPVVVFSELALLRCEDIQLKSQLEKIHGAAEQARDLLVEIRTLQGKAES
jgi:hypothetical protein